MGRRRDPAQRTVGPPFGYVAYFAWRTDKGMTAEIEEMLTKPIVVRFFNDVMEVRGETHAR